MALAATLAFPLFGQLGEAAGVLGSGAGHIQQHNQGVGMKCSEERHLLAALEFFQFRTSRAEIETSG